MRSLASSACRSNCCPSYICVDCLIFASAVLYSPCFQRLSVVHFSKCWVWVERSGFRGKGETSLALRSCRGSEAGSYLRLIEFVHHSTLGLRVIKKKKKKRGETSLALRSSASSAWRSNCCPRQCTPPWSTHGFSRVIQFNEGAWTKLLCPSTVNSSMPELFSPSTN